MFEFVNVTEAMVTTMTRKNRQIK